MTAFAFPGIDALRLALTSGALPSGVALKPARWAKDGPTLVVATDADVSPTATKKLAALGIQPSDEPPDAATVRTWLQLLPVTRLPDLPPLSATTPVLFELSAGIALPTMVGEMLRLGNDRQGFRPLPNGGALLRVIGPPFYTLLRAIDRQAPDAPRAYLEAAPRVWLEVGHTHPFAAQLKPGAGHLLLLAAPDEWRSLKEEPFQDIYELLEFALPAAPADWADRPPAGKLQIPVRLAAATTTDLPELWVLVADGIAQLDAWVRDADDGLVSRFAFAVGQRDGADVVILRVRPSKEPPPVLVLDAPAFRPYLKLPNLFLPLGTRLQPPLRRDAVRTLLAADADLVHWLTPTGDGQFLPETLPETAFRPLGDWVQYVLDRDAEPLGRWVAAARFDFAGFICPDDAPAPPKPSAARPPRAPREPDAPAIQGRAPPQVERGKLPTAPIAPPPAAAAFAPSELQAQLADAERAFLDVAGPLDAPERQRMWPRLADLHAALGIKADAAHCWLHAAWETADPPAEWLVRWRHSEDAADTPLHERLDRVLSLANPGVADLRSLVAAVLAAPPKSPALLTGLPAVQAYLRQHDGKLPVRAVWLAWSTLARLTGDVLALARTRDRLLERLLAEGLSAERDLPAFLRYAGRGDSDQLRRLREWVAGLRDAAQRWYAEPATGSGPRLFASSGSRDQTAAYIDLLFSFGLARLGEVSASRTLLTDAAAALVGTGDDAHEFLRGAFAYRIDQALAGKSHAGALPADQLEYLELLRAEANKLPLTMLAERNAPYVIDRLREQSRVLDPQEKFDPYRHIKREPDEAVAVLLRLPDVTDRQAMARQALATLAKLFKEASPTADRRARALAAGLALGVRGGEEFTLGLLTKIAPTLDALPPTTDVPALEARAALLERGLFFAAHYDHPTLAADFGRRLQELVATQAAGPGRSALASVVGQAVRSLKALGLKDRSAALLDGVWAAVLRGGSLDSLRQREPNYWAENLRLLLPLAAGWLQLDARERAEPILDEARAALFRRGTAAGQLYAGLACDYAAALGAAPFDYARPRIDELFAPGTLDRFPNNMLTNTHYSRFHLNMVEAVVMAMVTDDAALGPAAKRWLEEDEFLIRRRIHADTRRGLAAGGW